MFSKNLKMKPIYINSIIVDCQEKLDENTYIFYFIIHGQHYLTICVYITIPHWGIRASLLHHLSCACYYTAKRKQKWFFLISWRVWNGANTSPIRRRLWYLKSWMAPLKYQYLYGVSQIEIKPIDKDFPILCNLILSRKRFL